MKTIGKRLLALIEQENMKVSQFERECGISNGTISKAIEGDTTLSQKTIQKITNKYPGLNSDWLLNGKGEMFQKKYSAIKNEDTIVNEPQSEYKTHPLQAKISRLQEEYNELMKKYITLLEQNQSKK